VRLDEAFDSPERKRQYVRRLFSTIADRYDSITGFLSYGQDRRWKARLVREARVSASDVVLDLACGTGDIALAVAALGVERVIGLDITPRMLELAARKGGAVSWVAGDMGALPIGDAMTDIVTTGYGLRNVPDLDRALSEIARVLRPGGRFVSLDFNRPDSLLVRGPYLAYLTIVGAVLGWTLHGDPDCYRYIPASIRRYPGAAGVAARLARVGFTDIRVTPLFGGLMSLHLARRGGIQTLAPRPPDSAPA
jgi:demethylmenaquinone methyltransferase/2-methoxy-6-polyprenyl-1,4-benzoquinol methylase